MTHIHLLNLSLSNAYLIPGQKPILVDTGSPGDQSLLIQKMAEVGVEPADLALIVHNQVHVDHAGTSAWLKTRGDAPQAIHPLEHQRMRLGDNCPVPPTGINGRLKRIF